MTNGQVRFDETSVLSKTTDFAAILVEHGLEARATTARMAVPRAWFAQLNTYDETEAFDRDWEGFEAVKE